MKTHVKLTAIILCAAVFLCTAPLSGFVGLKLSDFISPLSASAAAETGYCGESVRWSLDKETGVLTISGNGDMRSYDYSSSYSPWYESVNLKSVIIESGVTSIGSFAFYGCTGLLSITIPDSVTNIKTGAFEGCTGLLSITIPDSVTSFEPRMFYGCTGLTSITISDSVTNIGFAAFFGCTGLLSITIPDSVTSIGDSVFSGCTELVGIEVDEGNHSYSSTAGILFNGAKNTLICYPAGKTDTDYAIPNRVTSIGNSSFYGCAGLTSITIPDSVTSIGNSVFYGCTGLTSITIPDSVISFEYYAFKGCTGLTSIAIPDNVTNISIAAFEDCTGLTSITIPDSVLSISAFAFKGCTGLTSITLPDSVLSISDSAFRGCTGLTSVTLPDNIQSIDNNVFNDCTGLTDIDVYEGNNMYASENGVLFNKSKHMLICYPIGKTDTAYTIPDSVGTICDTAFEGCTGLLSITIPDSVWNISDSAFKDCTGLLSITIPDSVRTISDSAFEGCTGLLSITIPDSVRTISACVFKGCTGLLSITMPDSVTSISTAAFEGCTGLLSITIPDSVWNISDSAFKGCTGLTSIAIPHNVGTISASAFEGCTGLLSITIPDSVRTISASAFKGCTGLTSVTIPDKAETISASAFKGCTALIEFIVSESSQNYFSMDGVLFNKRKTILLSYPIGKTDETYTIPDSVTSISDYAFSGCTGLTSITVPYNVYFINYSAFDNMTSLADIYIYGKNVDFSFSRIGFYEEESTGEYVCNIPTVIHGYTGSTAEAYANNNGLTFVPFVVTCTHENTQLINIVAATCTAEGYSGDTYCKSCEKIVARGMVISALGHTWNDGEITTVATCTAEGVKTFTCSRCSTTKTEAIAKIAHTIVDDAAVAATCTETGLTAGTHCSACNTVFTAQTAVKALGHTYDIRIRGAWTVTKAATTEKEGTETRVCSGCNKAETRSIAKLQPEAKKTIEVKTGTEIKLSADGKYVIIVDGMDVNKLLESASKGVSLLTADGKAVKDGDKAASGMKLVLKDGETLLDSKTIIVPGDVDGDASISAADARLALRYSVKLEQLSDLQIFAADTDWDKSGTAADARLILRASVGLEKIADWLAAYK